MEGAMSIFDGIKDLIVAFFNDFINFIKFRRICNDVPQRLWSDNTEYAHVLIILVVFITLYMCYGERNMFCFF